MVSKYNDLKIFPYVLLCLYMVIAKQSFVYAKPTLNDTSQSATSSSFPSGEVIRVKDLDSLMDTTSIQVPVPIPAAATVPKSVPLDSTSSKQELGNLGVTSNGGATANEKGIILSVETGKPIPMAPVLLTGTSEKFSSMSDADGIYHLSGIRPGFYRIKVGKKGFAVYEREGLQYLAGENPVREIRLERSVLKGQVIEAKRGNNTGSAASMMAARKNQSGVMEGVGAEQIAKSTDADAGAVAKRITGTSLVGGKYIYVRGLGERYTNMTLNGLPVPSPETDKRVVPQDLFPASALDRFVLYKTFSPDLYGDFAGGSVALETKGIPEKRILKFTMGTGGTDYSGDNRFLNFGQDRLSYEGGNTFWGYDDGTRSLPPGVPTRIPIRKDDEVQQYKDKGLPAYTRSERADFATSFKNVYALDTSKVRLNGNYSLTYGDVKTQGNSKMGFLLSAGFKNKYNQRDKEQHLMGGTPITTAVQRFIPILNKTVTVYESLKDTVPVTIKTSDGRDTVVDSAQTVFRIAPGIDRTVRSGTYEASLTGLADFGWEINQDNRLFWKNFFVNLGTDEAAQTLSKKNPSGSLSQDRPVEERYLLEFNRRSLYSTQFGGGNYLGFGAADSFSWAGGYSRTSSETPDSRKYLYSKESDSAKDFENTNNDVWGTRIYEGLSENAIAGRSDLRLLIPPEWSQRDLFWTGGKVLSNLRLPEVRVGISGNIRHRDFDATRYAYDSDRNIYQNTTLETIREPKALQAKILQGVPGFDFTTSPKAHDKYNVSEGVFSSYGNMDWGFSFLKLPLDLEAGMRLEYHRLDLNSPFTGDNGDNQAKIDSLAVNINNRDWDLLPSLGLSIHPWKNGKVHFHYSKSLTRPEFRELAPYAYYNYSSGRDITGNPTLRQTTVRNLDLRFDWFLPGQQLVSVSLFDKEFRDPIEVVGDINQSQGFQNATSAYVRGIEFEGNLDISYMLNLVGAHGFLARGWVLYGNYALMRSKVVLDTSETAGAIAGTSSRDLTSQSRALFGQSPYLFNLKLSHEIEGRRWTFLNALLYNVAGERIKEAGVGGVPDVYEQPFPSLDYLGKVNLPHNLEVSWAIKNLLNKNKRSKTYEYNRDRKYYKLDEAKIQSAFSPYPGSYDTEVVDEGTGYEIKIGYGI